MAVNPAVNAVVAPTPIAPRAAAAESDRRLAAGTARPLEGLPITVKDAFDVAGLRSTAGAACYRDRIPTADAAPVARLRAAGAVIVAKRTSRPSSADFQSYNPVYGTTNNPWDLARSPGGSSGGAAAAVATGMSAFELASDLGSSIRWPAHACGIFGLKTTWGLVPTWGHVPPPPERRTARNVDVMVAGPLARSAADLDLVLPVLAGPRDATVSTPLRRRAATDPRGLRVALWVDDPSPRRKPEVDGGGAARGGAPRRGRRDRRRERPAGGALRGGVRGVLAPQPLHRRLWAAAEDPAAPAEGRRGGLAERSLAPGAAGPRRAHDARRSTTRRRCASAASSGNGRGSSRATT